MQAEARNAMIQTQLQVSRDILGSDESRAKLIQAINAAVDVPILGEVEEEAILATAVGMCADTLQMLLPLDLIEMLKGESPQSLFHMKEYLIKTVNQKVDLAGLPEEQELVLIEKLVDILIDTYVDDTEAEFLLLTKEEQQDALQERAAALVREMELSTNRYEREQQNRGTIGEDAVEDGISELSGTRIKVMIPKQAATYAYNNGKQSRLVSSFHRGGTCS